MHINMNINIYLQPDHLLAKGIGLSAIVLSLCLFLSLFNPFSFQFDAKAVRLNQASPDHLLEPLLNSLFKRLLKPLGQAEARERRRRGKVINLQEGGKGSPRALAFGGHGT